jgi:membrane protein DedA with SNARE-associated domain
MIAELVAQLIFWIKQLGWVGVFVGVILESIIAPIPSPLIPMGAGFVLIPTKASLQEAMSIAFFTIALIGAFGSTLGAFLGYGIGYLGGKPVIEKFKRFLGVSWGEIERSRKLFERGYKDELILFVSRAIPIIPLSPVSFCAGVIRLDVKRFTLLTFLGTIPRYFVLGLLGWFAGITYEEISKSIEFFETLAIFGFVALMIFVIYKIRKKKG